MGSARDEVVGPDMILSLGPEPDARTVVQPEPSTLRLLLRNLKPFTSPDPLNSLVVDVPTKSAEQRGDPAIAIPAILGGQVDDIPGQPFLISGWLQLSTLCCTWLIEDLAGSTLCNAESSPDVIDALSAT